MTILSKPPPDEKPKQAPELRKECPRESSVLNILRSTNNLQLSPQTRTNHAAESKQDAKGDAETPDRLQFEAGSLRSSSPHPVVDFTYVLTDGSEERGCAAPGIGEGRAVEVGERFADCDGDDDHGDEDRGVEGGGDQEREHAVPVEDVGDYYVEGSYDGL